MTYREIEITVGISGTSIHSILHEHMTVKKFVRVGSHTIFSIAQKKARVRWSKEMLQKYDRGTSKHVYDIVIGDESWIQDEPNPTKVDQARSTSKQMIAFFSEKLYKSPSVH